MEKKGDEAGGAQKTHAQRCHHTTASWVTWHNFSLMPQCHRVMPAGKARRHLPIVQHTNDDILACPIWSDHTAQLCETERGGEKQHRHSTDTGEA